MRKIEKIAYIQDNHFSEWFETRKKVNEEVSDKYSMWCVCRKLCTGFHEMNCTRFQNEVNNETLERLKHLITNK